MLNAPYDTSSSGGYIDRLAEYVVHSVDTFFSAMAAPPLAATSSHAMELEPWVHVDPAVQGQMSMFLHQKEGSISVHYLSYEFTEGDLLSWYKEIKDNDPSYGEEVVDRLMEPFKQFPSANEQDAWLNSTVVSAYMACLQSNRLQVLDPGYYQRSDFLSSLPSRSDWVKKLQSANQIFWPICEGCHWYLMVIEKVRGTTDYSVKVLDSFNNREKHTEIATKGIEFLHRLYKEQPCRVVNRENPSYLVPMQDNAIDCGTAICYYAYKRSQGRQLSAYASYTNHECSYVQFRLHMAQSIALNLQLQKKPAPLLPSRKPCVIEILDDKSEPKSQKRRTLKT